MTAWIDTLNGLRRSTQAWDAPERAPEVGYGGPADGDFARYVDQLLAQAEHRRRPQRDARAPASASAQGSESADSSGSANRPTSARRMPAPQGRNPAAGGAARARAAAARAANPAFKALLWRKLIPLAFWLALAVALFFWQGAAVWLIGLLVVVGVLSRGLRGKNR